VKQPARPQQVIELLAKRLEKRWLKAEAGQPVPNCKFGTEPPPRRGGGCSVCKVSQELELDQAVAHLINTSTFKRTGVCPYQVIASHLVVGLVFGPETIRGRSAGRYLVDPVVELKGALKRIGTVLHAAAVARDDIEALREQSDWWKALNAVLSAERALGDALALFRSEASGNRMSPSFAVKGSVRYPFYVSSALLKGRQADAGSVLRVFGHGP